MHHTQPIKLSVVATLYKTGPYLAAFARRTLAAAQKCGFTSEETEIVWVNDGCPETSLQDALAVKAEYQEARIRIVDLSRNFGHHRAMLSGLRHAQGELVLLIDSDLEEDPEWLELFLDKLHDCECDVVYGVQGRRKGGWFEQKSGTLFYKIFNALAEHKIAENSVTARLMTRRYVNSLLGFQESDIFLFGIASFVGFEQVPCQVEKRDSSPTSYTLYKKIVLAFNSLVSYSSKPLVSVAIMGFTTSFFSFMYLLWLCIRRLFFAEIPTGWTTITVSIWLVGGLVIFCQGIVSLYVAKIFSEVKGRPQVLVRRIYD